VHSNVCSTANAPRSPLPSPSQRPQAARVVAQAASTAERVSTPKSAAPGNKPATQKPTVIITGASSGLGLNAAAQLAKGGDWHVVMACRCALAVGGLCTRAPAR
jgi:NADPH:quinone reductase-like Zn-dependent oxidoreductase